jgi:mannose-6-phosphate isomerase
VPRKDAAAPLADCRYFTTNLLDMEAGMVRDFSSLDSFVVYICMDGQTFLRDNRGNELLLRRGQTVLVPADTTQITLAPSPQARLLETYIG